MTSELFRATSTKMVPRTVNFLYDTFAEECAKLKTIDALFSFVYQPFTANAMKAAIANGGDPINLNPADGPAMRKSNCSFLYHLFSQQLLPSIITRYASC